MKVLVDGCAPSFRALCFLPTGIDPYQTTSRTLVLKELRGFVRLHGLEDVG